MPYLLQTKTQLPPLRKQHIHRHRLVQQMVAKVQSRLVLVTAPAGFGKSSCLIEWAHTAQQRGTLVAWYALDEQDNDPARFTAYLLNAFRLFGGVFDNLPDNQEQVNIQEAANRILNSAAEYDKPVILVLDDYHLISEPQIHDAISLMAEYLPMTMRLAIGTRADPPLQLARLRAHGMITEIRMADLRFNMDEMARWLQSALGWNPSARVLRQLDALTEGWAVALALIVMNQSEADEQAIESQLNRYSLSQQHIFDYFVQEVYEQQSETLKGFLLDTCVLNWLQPDLCYAMTGRRDASLLLNQLAADSLFVIPLSETDPIYRYHHLFEQFLRQQLEMMNRARYLEKHRRAAEWLIAHHKIVEAVYHGLAAEDFDYAAMLIETRAWETLTSRGEIMTIINWLPHFQDETLKCHPRLCLYFSRALYLTGDIERSQHYVQLTLPMKPNRPSPSAIRRPWRRTRTTSSLVCAGLTRRLRCFIALMDWTGYESPTRMLFYGI